MLFHQILQCMGNILIHYCKLRINYLKAKSTNRSAVKIRIRFFGTAQHRPVSSPAGLEEGRREEELSPENCLCSRLPRLLELKGPKKRIDITSDFSS